MFFIKVIYKASLCPWTLWQVWDVLCLTKETDGIFCYLSGHQDNEPGHLPVSCYIRTMEISRAFKKLFGPFEQK